MQPHSSSTPEKSPFNLLIEDIEVLRDAREQRDRARFRAAVAASAARQQAEAQRNRRLHVQRQQHQQRRPMAKATPPAPPPDFDAIARQQALLEAAMRDNQKRQQQNAIRDHIAEMREAARAGQLDAMTACKLDALIGQAAAMGLQP